MNKEPSRDNKSILMDKLLHKRTGSVIKNIDSQLFIYYNNRLLIYKQNNLKFGTFKLQKLL